LQFRGLEMPADADSFLVANGDLDGAQVTLQAVIAGAVCILAVLAARRLERNHGGEVFATRDSHQRMRYDDVLRVFLFT
jgi:hypothetical protein